jgi:hypothetical protein
MTSFSQLSGGGGVKFLVRWRGKQEGPHPASAIETKLAANEIGLLHEIFHDGKWITIRDYVAEREAVLRAERQAREEQERKAREEAERQVRERQERNQVATLAEERRRNDLLAAELDRQNNLPRTTPAQPILLRPHRAGLILTLALVGLFIFGPLCLAAWVMGSGDLREMDAGTMDSSGRSSTSSGRNIGVLGTLLWIAAVVILFVH